MDEPTITLHEAVSQTANKELDSPSYVFFTTRSKIQKRAYEVLETLGYAKTKWSKNSSKFPSRKRKSIHPKTWAYYNQFGVQYIECLEAVLRLTQN